MSEPTLSVVMPVHNGGDYLATAIRSILGQTYTEFEFLIIDDGSSDGSLGVIEDFAKTDARIRLVSRENRGLVASLNEGIELARGEYIARMDADDIALPERFEKQLSYLRANPGIDVLGGQVRVIDEAGRETGRTRKPSSASKLVNYLNFGCPIVHPTYMLKSKVYRTLRGYRDFVAVEDLDFLLRAAETGFNLGNLADVVLLYRQNSTGMSARNARRQARGARLVLALHRARVFGLPEPERTIQDLMGRKTIAGTGWFEYWWRWREWALGLRQQQGVRRALGILVVFVSSLMHYELMLASYRAWRAQRLVGLE